MIFYYDEVKAKVGLRSNFTLGPIEVVKKALRTYTPLAPLGLAFTIASTIEDRFPISFSGSKLALPTTM